MTVTIERPKSGYPELIVTVPDDWPHVQLAPLYDVHFGHRLHASDQFLRHTNWLADQPPGGQRNAARKDMPWIEADLYWTGHLHQPMVDLVARFDFDQSTNLMVPRDSLVIISPSYLLHFGGYGAAKRYAPGVTGLI